MELLDVYNNNGVRTGRVVVRGDKNVVLSDDEHIAVGVIFIENSEGKFLMQKTSVQKGGEYSSTGGHIVSGEEPIISIRREVEEELGIDVSHDNIIELGFLLYDRPIRFLFYLKKDIDINDVVVQTEEVEFVKYMTISEINELIDKELITKSHGILFKELLRLIDKNKISNDI